MNCVSCFCGITIRLWLSGFCFLERPYHKGVNVEGWEANSLETGTFFTRLCYIACVNKPVCLSRMVNH